MSNERTIAVLCASRDSVYHQMRNLEVYDELRNARTFGGGMPIVAHPPCRAWSAHCRHQAKPVPGEMELAPLCVEWLAICGGVLEHPANSRLWDHLNLPKPGERERGGLETVPVLQSWFGDSRSKKTWLLVSKIDLSEEPIPFSIGNRDRDLEAWNKLSKRKRAATPPAMAAWLVGLARKVKACQELSST